MLLSFGTKLLSKSAATVILSVVASPIVMLPPNVRSPVMSTLPETFKLSCIVVAPETVTGLFKLISLEPAASMFKSPVIVSTVLPAILILPVSIFAGVISVVCPPAVNVIPVSVVTSNVPPWNVVLPVS